jgi:D-glycerate 3-kinase
MQPGLTGVATPDAVDRLIGAQGLPASYRDVVDRVWVKISAHIADRARKAGGPLIVGILGAQGSGKTTMCLFLECLLLRDHQLRAGTLSLDDLYLARSERQSLAAGVHPLLATRGPPGTHDVDLGAAMFAAVIARARPLRLPRFDKGLDDSVPRDRWPICAEPLDVLLFEGWCVGATPQLPPQLETPVNHLEELEDPHGTWRRYVNDALAGPYRRMFQPLDLLVMLAAPRFEAVLGWRQEQERKLRARTGLGMQPAEVERFVAHFERLTRHMIATMPGNADILVALGEDQQVNELLIAGLA